MSRLSKPELLNVIVSAIAESGWNTLYLDNHHPFRLQLFNAETSYRLRIYIWNITHGGGKARPADEYRIQITGVNRFEFEPDGKTLILGWWDEAGVFAGFDFNKHNQSLGASPSFQIRETCLQEAYANRFALCLKENQEIAVAFRPDFFVEYVASLEGLHQSGDSPQVLETLQQVASDPYGINDHDLEELQEDRRIVVSAVQRRLRSSSFRSRVLTVYNHSCAFCGLQMNLVQAAHILPITHAESTDDTYNGIAACFLHHAAYDRGLIAFDDSYRIVTNSQAIESLVLSDRGGGSENFRHALRPFIILPPAVADRPHIELVRRANQVRGWRV